jgi:hypothetical protein
MEVDQLKTRFFVNVGHVHTPLTLVLGPIEDLARRLARPERVASSWKLAHLQRAARAGADRGDPRRGDRLEHGRMAFRREHVALAQLVRRTLERSSRWCFATATRWR